MFKGKNIVKMRNVLAVSALAFVAMPAMTLAEEIGGSDASSTVTGSALTENVTLKSNVTLSTKGFDVAAKDADNKDIKAITIDLGGYKLSASTFAAIDPTSNANVTITIKNGTLDCGGATCVNAANLILDNVKVEGTGAVVVSKAATISNSTLAGLDLSAASVKATINGGAVKTLTTNTTAGSETELKISGKVEGPLSALDYAEKGATIVLNGNVAAGTQVKVPEGVTLELAANKTVSFEADMSPADAGRVKVSIPDYELKFVENSVGTYKLQAISADFTEFDKVWKEFQKWDDDAQKVADAKDKYTEVLYNEVITAAGKIATDSADKDNVVYAKSTQSYVNSITTNLKNIMSGSAIDPTVPVDPVDPDKKPTDPVTPVNPDDNKGDSKPDQSGDDKKTGDNIMGYVSLALTSLGGLAVAVKKYLFR